MSDYTPTFSARTGEITMWLDRGPIQGKYEQLSPDGSTRMIGLYEIDPPGAKPFVLSESNVEQLRQLLAPEPQYGERVSDADDGVPYLTPEEEKQWRDAGSEGLMYCKKCERNQLVRGDRPHHCDKCGDTLG